MCNYMILTQVVDLLSLNKLFFKFIVKTVQHTRIILVVTIFSQLLVWGQRIWVPQPILISSPRPRPRRKTFEDD